MTSIRSSHPALVAALAALLILPATAVASDGGVGVPAPEEEAATETGSGLTVSAKKSVWLGKRVTVGGHSPDAGTSVTIQRKAPRGAWTTIATVKSGSDGAFKTKWAPDSPGRFDVRAVTAGASGSTGPAVRASSSHELLVYRPLIATWYGPGFFGRKTACGLKLTKETQGVAHRTLPCGTKVAISYRGRETVVPVIDRGPYANGADYDLTQATAREVGMTTTAKVGALPLRDR